MPKQVFKICENCSVELRQNRENFKRTVDSVTKKETYNSVCRACEEIIVFENEWKDGKLKCHICNEYFSEDIFHKSEHYQNRNFRDKRCSSCKVK
jgi:hypothetical protein